jgi:HEAT repeat protein
MPAARSLLVTLLLLAALAPGARASGVDELIDKLRADPDYKVRLSAALNLGKLGDRRAFGALVDALGDRDRNVRSVAAGALGKLLDDRTTDAERARALAARWRAPTPTRWCGVRRGACSRGSRPAPRGRGSTSRWAR